MLNINTRGCTGYPIDFLRGYGIHPCVQPYYITYSIVFAITLSVLLSLLIFAGLFGRYKTFEKIGLKPWKSLIPFYGTYCLYKELEYADLYAVYIISLIISFVPNYYINLISSIILVAVVLKASIKLSKRFNQNLLFGICLGIFDTIMYFVLAVGEFSYIKPVKQESQTDSSCERCSMCTCCKEDEK